MRVPYPALFCFIALSLSFLTNCTLIENVVGWGVSKPQIKLVSASVGAFSPRELSLVLKVAILNPNSFDLEFSHLDYDLKIKSIKLASGSKAPNIIIPARTSKTVDLPLSLDLRQSLATVKNIMTGNLKNIFVQWTGTAQFHSPLGTVKMKISEQKNLQ